MSELNPEAESEESRPSPQRRSGVRFGFIAIFVLMQLLALVFAFEIGGRLLDPRGISYFPETARFFDNLILEEPIGYRLRPGLEGEFYGAHVEINSAGMRDREVASEKSPAEFRLMVLGDSVPFSIGVEFEESIPHQIELLSNENAGPGVRVRTLNMGVPSYNTEQELIQLESMGMNLEPDAAVLIFSANDLEPKMWGLAKRSGFLTNIAQRSYAASLGFVVYRELKRSFVKKSGVAFEPKKSPWRTDNPRWQAIDEALTGINRTFEEAGVPFLLTYRPFDDPELGMRIREVAEREGFPARLIDVMNDPRWRDDELSQYRNSASDSHCNAAGCRIWATVIQEALVAEGMLP